MPSDFPNSLVAVNPIAEGDGNCCCALCPQDAFDGQNACAACPPSVLMQVPTYTFECEGGENPPCSGIFDLPLLDVPRVSDSQATCDWQFATQSWCDDPGQEFSAFFIKGGCGDIFDVVFNGLLENVKKWMVVLSFSIGPSNEPSGLTSVFINYTGPPTGFPGTFQEHCIAPGTYTHIGTFVGSNAGAPCRIILTAPVGDLLVIFTEPPPTPPVIGLPRIPL